MKIAQPENKARPYWHVDAKWVFGILLFFALGAALLLYNLQALTERERAVTISANIVATLFSPEGLDDDEGLDEVRKQAEASGQDDFAPIEAFPWVTVSKEELATLSARDLRISIFRQITETIYDEGLQGAAEKATDEPEKQEKFVNDATALGLFTKTTHESLKQAFFATAALSLVLAAGLVFFSAGWGRAVSPAIVLLVVSTPGALAALLVKNPPTDGDDPLANMPEHVATEVGGALSQSYLAAAILAVVLLLIALIGKIVQKFIRHPSKSKRTDSQ